MLNRPASKIRFLYLQGPVRGVAALCNRAPTAKFSSPNFFERFPSGSSANSGSRSLIPYEIAFALSSVLDMLPPRRLAGGSF
jgi:hypothetical protein